MDRGGRFHVQIRCGSGGYLRRKQRVTALACANDDMAAGAMLALAGAGWIPSAISVTGFDDTPMSVVWPPLTTIRPIKDLAERAITC